MSLKRYEDDHNLTLEEAILLMEAADDRLKENPLDPRALSDYNRFYQLVYMLKNA